MIKRVAYLAVALAALLTAVPVSAKNGSIVVDDDGLDCPDADYATIADAVAAASTGDTIVVCTGTYAGAVLDKTLHVVARGRAVINDGPNSHSFLRAGFLFPGGDAGSGSTIRGFSFVGMPQATRVDDGHLDFPIFSREANDVTVEYNVMMNSLQAVTNWHGSGWTIQHNRIDGLWVLCGGGIGVLVGSVYGGEANHNLIAHNDIAADVSPDCAYFTTTGIVLYSDTRWGAAGGPVEENKVLHNRSKVTGEWEGQPAGVGFEMTDGGLLEGGDGYPDLVGNTVAFNDFRGSSIEVNLRPEEIEDNNTLSRNLGPSRGHGEVPPSELFH